MPALKEGLPIKRQLSTQRVMPETLLMGTGGGGPPVHPVPSASWPGFSPSVSAYVLPPTGTLPVPPSLLPSENQPEFYLL